MRRSCIAAARMVVFACAHSRPHAASRARGCQEMTRLVPAAPGRRQAGWGRFAEASAPAQTRTVRRNVPGAELDAALAARWSLELRLELAPPAEQHGERRPSGREEIA